jgi:hypothetical protein
VTISTAGTRAFCEIDDALDVAGEISDSRIHLRNRNFHGTPDAVRQICALIFTG